MPELPEVQTIVDDLNGAGIQGRRICNVDVFWLKSVATLQDFAQRLEGAVIENVARRGKYIVILLHNSQTLLIHLRMSGRIILCPSYLPVSSHEHVILKLDDKRDIRLHDTRKFGRMYLVDNPDEILAPLGLEPLGSEFTPSALKKILKAHARMLKPLLLDQHVLAGLGNIYVDEALWEARLHPQRISNSLTQKEIAALHQAIVLVLQRGLKNRGTSLGDGKANFTSLEHTSGSNAESLKVFRRTGQACPRCDASITRLVVGQRGTHICSRCQVK